MLNWADHSDIEQRLRVEVDAARTEYEAVGRQAYLPAGEYPEDVKRQALEIYLRALMRFAGFTLSGTVPEDLLPPN
jgi:hypothetical protein